MTRHEKVYMPSDLDAVRHEIWDFQLDVERAGCILDTATSALLESDLHKANGRQFDEVEALLQGLASFLRELHASMKASQDRITAKTSGAS